MTVMIRMTRAGRRNLPFFHIVAANKQNARDGRFIEKLGYFNPLTKELSWNAERVEHWLKTGAQPSEKVAKLLIKEGVGPKSIHEKFQKLFDHRVRVFEAKQKAEADKKAAEEKAVAAAAAAEEAAAAAEAAAAETPAEEAPADEATAS